MELSLVNIFIVIAIVIFGGSAIAFIIARLYIHYNKNQIEVCDNLDISLKEIVQRDAKKS